MNAEIIAIGSEMLTPHRQDTNSLFLTQHLNDLGVTVAFKTIVGDSFEHLTSAISLALRRADIVLLSGGLGPTEDDLTREAAARALHLRLRRSETILEGLRERFRKRGYEMSDNNARQADVLDGATVLANANGSAPGQYLTPEVDGAQKILILLPGPPNELKHLFKHEALPLLAATVPPLHIATRHLRISLLPESQVDARTAPIYRQFPDVETTILAGRGEIHLHFTTTKASAEEARARVDELADLIHGELGDDIYSSNGESLEEVVLLMLGMRNLTLTCAESLTGGLLAQRITAVQNASRAFLGGAIVYTPDMKTRFADVPKHLLETKGSVCPEVAGLLAQGICRFTNSSLGIALTGIAGPPMTEGPDKDKPVGLVYIGLSDGHTTSVKELRLNGDRERIRLWASQHALDILRRHVM